MRLHGKGVGLALKRREVLHLLACATGSAFAAGDRLAAQATPERKSPIEPQPQSQLNPVHPQAVSHEDIQMEKVLGIGGLFFRAQDPAALGHWYQEHLGISLTPQNYHESVWQTEAGPTVFTPFPLKSKYFGDPKQTWMVNFRVRNLDRMVAQLRGAGITVDVDPQEYPNGRFARLHDPEGNPIELWQPAGSGATT